MSKAIITEVTGNIFNYLENGDYLLHQVNCQGVMGAGIAKTIKEEMPDVFYRYKLYVDSYGGMTSLLGSCQTCMTKWNGISITVCNLFGQDNFGRTGDRFTDYDALEQAMKIALWSSRSNTRFVIPMFIGCGYGGGNWDTVMDIIERVFVNRSVLLVRYDESPINK